MQTHTPLAAFGSSSDSDLRPALASRGGWIEESMDRVRQALVDRQVPPLSREEWAELRASLTAMRPAPPPSKLPHATSLFNW